MSILRYRLAARAQSVPSSGRRPAAGGKKRRVGGRCAPLPVRGRIVRPANLRGAVRQQCSSAIGATDGADCIVHHLGLALGGRPAASFARRLMLPVSNDTLLRVIRRRAHVPTEPLSVIGIDDWAWRRNHRYGMIICDLERRRPVTLLPDREPATATASLERHQEIAVMARDRGGGYGEAVTRALPRATQVADRWHLMENASRAFLDAVRKTMRQIRAAIGATTSNPELLTAAERLQYEGYQRREEINAAILALAKDNVPIKEIVRRLGHSRQLVRRVIRGEREDIFRIRQSSLERHLSWLDAQWSSGCRNGADLWRRLKGQGFFKVPSEWSPSGPPAADAQRKLMPRI